MNLRRLLLIASCWISVLPAEVVTEFDGKAWNTGGDEATRANDIAESGHCLIADSQVKMKQAAQEIRHLGTLQHHPIRFALRGQEGKGALLDSFPSDVTPPNLMIVVTCDPAGIDVGCVKVAEIDPEVFETGRMSVEFEGIDEFLSVIKAGVKRSTEAGVPAAVCLNVRSETSWGQMVRVLQIVRAAGCRFGIVKINDTFPGLDFEVKMDPRVNPPVAKEMDPSKISRIVVNLHDDGHLSDRGQKPISGDQNLKDYIRREKERADISGKQAMLFLRGSKEAVFKGSRRVIGAAAEAGVDQVVFAAYEIKKPESPTGSNDNKIEPGPDKE